MPDDLQPNPEKSVQFLCWLNSPAHMYFEHMRSEGPARPTAKVYAIGDSSSAISFVEANNASTLRRNMYFLPNFEFLEGKRAKANLSAARFVHVDLDYKDYPGDPEEVADDLLDRIQDEKRRPKGIPMPTAVWFTGGGIQAVWRLREPVSVEDAEEINRGLIGAFDGDPVTHDASRLMRLPFTVNWLNDKKRAAGREPDVAWLIEPFTFRKAPISYGASDIKVARVKKNNGSIKGSASTALVQPGAIEAIPLPEDRNRIIPSEPKWVEVIVDGTDPPGKAYQSRSERVFAVVVWLLGQKVEPGYIVSIILEPDWKISEHIRENANPLKYAQRQVARGQEVVAARGGNWPVVGENGLPTPNLPENIRFALAHLGISAQRNTFTQSDEVSGQGLENRDLNEISDILASEFSRSLQYGATPAAIRREILSLAHDRPYHPVVEYLDSLKWDGTGRLDTWLTDYAGAERSELNSEFGRKLLIAGVRRIKRPGIKFDTMLVLEGSQGTGKSQMAASLAVREEWFCGSLDLKSDDKTKAELLQRAWIVECQELDGLNKATGESLKRFLSTSIDSFRKAYARDAGEYRRHCIIIGTTNEGEYLRDLTGNRRIWPVSVNRIEIEAFRKDVDQLWAEAVEREANGESITLSRHLWDAAKSLQGSRMVDDAFADKLQAEFVEIKGKVSMDSIKLLLGVDTFRMSPTDSRRIKAAMAHMGWKYGNFRLHDFGGTRSKPRKGFARGSDEERKVEYIAEHLDAGIYTIVEFAKPAGLEPF